MTPEQFTYWLQGKLEGRNITDLGHSELRMIQEHLNTVFKKVTPNILIGSGSTTVPGRSDATLCTCGSLTIGPCPVHTWGPHGTILC